MNHQVFLLTSPKILVFIHRAYGTALKLHVPVHLFCSALRREFVYLFVLIVMSSFVIQSFWTTDQKWSVIIRQGDQLVWENQQICTICEIRQGINHIPKFSAKNEWSYVSTHTHWGFKYHGGRYNLPDSFDHAEAHFNTAMSMVLAGLRQSWHTVVAVPQDFNAKTVMLLKGTEW